MIYVRQSFGFCMSEWLWRQCFRPPDGPSPEFRASGELWSAVIGYMLPSTMPALDVGVSRLLLCQVVNMK